MPRFRVNVTFAPAGGRRLYHGEIVDIDENRMEPYGAFVTKRWLSPVDEPTGETPTNGWRPGDDELAVIDVGDPDVDLPAESNGATDGD